MDDVQKFAAPLIENVERVVVTTQFLPTASATPAAYECSQRGQKEMAGKDGST